ncbi:MAG: methylmalonyl Co-A mutase-associated GTPase MeaB [Anaerolineales bacterium]
MLNIQPILDGDRLALARALTQIENGTPAGWDLLNALFPHTGRAHLIGITGAPGTGKSSLVNQLARAYRAPLNGGSPKRVAILAVDPSSPFTGGAILGDRIRMRDLSGDSGVFIRSMAARGALGGISATTAAAAQAFDAAGYDVILIETVGAGQSEVDIARLAHTTLVVEAPGLGDDIQAIKAGILEIADLLIVNKADHPGTEATERALKNMLQLAHPVARVFNHHGVRETAAAATTSNAPLWIPPILRTVATEAQGIAEVVQQISAHQAYLQSNGEWQQRERERLQDELERLIQATLWQRWREKVPPDLYPQTLQALQARTISPHEAVQKLLPYA